MGDQAIDELVASLKGLYDNQEYCDLKIVSQDRVYSAHQAIVCPRSSVFAAQCREEENQNDGCAAVRLLADDPRAVEMVVQYFYHLDYPCAPAEGPHTNGWAAGEEQGETEYCDALQSPAAPAPPEATADPQEEVKSDRPPSEASMNDFLPKTVLPKPKSKKKKKRSKSVAQADAEGRPELKELQPPIPEGDAEGEAEPDPEPALPTPPPEPATPGLAPPPAPVPASVTMPASSLVTHAKVYSLSQKYAISGLKSLSLQKFETEARELWDSDDFLLAAREVYTDPAGKDYDRRMRDVIVGIVCEHLEVLDKEATDQILEGLALSHDVLKRARKEGLLK